jgi:hypothetical protein
MGGSPGNSQGVGAYNHALLWSGTAESCIDLNPSGFGNSYAYGVSGSQQVGGGRGDATGDWDHALLWSGTAGSYVDLNPTGFTWSVATGVSDGHQVGYGGGWLWGHALLWSGTADSYVDLNPPSGFVESVAYSVSGGQQVGYGVGTATGNCEHALVWSGTPESYVDLHDFLPPGYIYSYAYGIDSAGNVVGAAAQAFTGVHHAVLWVKSEPPEPPALPVSIDIQPGRCPNPLNVRSKGVLPVAILGKEDFDVTNIASAMLEGVGPVDLDLFDATAPIGPDAGECECTKAKPDGFMDLVLYFDTQEIVAALGAVKDGDVLSLTLEGSLVSGILIKGSDCIVIAKKGKGK